MPVLTLDQIESLCADALKRAGASDEQAAIVAEEIMDAEAEGIRNVGLGYLHLYLKHLRRGWVHFAAAKMLQVQVQIAEPHIADPLGLGVHDLLGDDRRLFVAGAGAFQRISA